MLSRRLNAFVNPTSQTIPIAQPRVVARDELDRDGTLQHDDRGGDLRTQLRSRVKLDDVVEQAEGEYDRARSDHGEQLIGDTHRTDGSGGSDGCDEAGEDPDPAERRRRARVPAVGPRIGSEEGESSRPVKQAGDRHERDRRCRDRDKKVHGRRGEGDGLIEREAYPPRWADTAFANIPRTIRPWPSTPT